MISCESSTIILRPSAFMSTSWTAGTTWRDIRLSVLTLMCGAWVAHAQPSEAARYEVDGVQFAQIRGIRMSYFVPGVDTARRTDLAYVVWVLKEATAGARGRTVLFDAGFYRDKFLSPTLVGFLRPTDAVTRVGVRPDDVTDVIISHIHWDHVDGADLFPNARIWLQRAEYEHYVDDRGMPRDKGIDTVDAEMLARLSRAGRIRLVDGDGQEIVPGITAYTGARHTFGSQYLAIRTVAGTVVLASDDAVMYENLAKHLPISATFTPDDRAANLRAQDRMRGLATDPRFILPGHDPQIFVRFPEPGNGVARIQ